MQVEVQLSGFVKHLFTSAWVEILMMVLAILFYLGDSTTSVAHFVFIFVLHILRCASAMCVGVRVASVILTIVWPVAGRRPCFGCWIGFPDSTLLVRAPCALGGVLVGCALTVCASRSSHRFR